MTVAVEKIRSRHDRRLDDMSPLRNDDLDNDPIRDGMLAAQRITEVVYRADRRSRPQED